MQLRGHELFWDWRRRYYLNEWSINFCLLGKFNEREDWTWSGAFWTLLQDIWQNIRAIQSVYPQRGAIRFLFSSVKFNSGTLLYFCFVKHWKCREILHTDDIWRLNQASKAQIVLHEYLHWPRNQKPKRSLKYSGSRLF